ncbi:ATP-binding cassette domain-containing protein [Ureibacillus thermosphaericus]|jgi:peptide/nickel transport system ATP-binding protein|uniref:ABC transporter ATP-binding protein n=1 Tax=Ureibacillus suwonensis TaxID=313007 RepID=A0ABW0RG74_9BACL|nr:ABC transporter ATP-binding protein [Bacilli bacterium]
MLKCKNISFQYNRSTWLFRNVNFALERGEIVGMFGKSGSGKTTLAKIMANYLSPAEGEVIIDGEKSVFPKVYPVQLIWQHPEQAINPKWKLSETIEEVEELDKEIIDILGIKREWFNRRPHELSGGELQRFCIARAFHPDTRYIIADEITSMFDAITQAQIWHALIRLVKERNIGVLAISHHISLLERISDRIIDFNQLKSCPM